MRISDWSSDVCSSDLCAVRLHSGIARPRPVPNPVRRACRARPARARRACRRTVGRAVPPPCTASVCSWFAFLLSCCGGIFLRQATGLAQRFTQHVFDLGVEAAQRSEEHTSELQSLMRISYAVFCLKKKIETQIQNNN